MSEWTSDLEFAFQQLRQRRGGAPFEDAEMEAAYQAARSRRFGSTPSADVLEQQLREQRGE